jgi:site-specific recombinase XerD
LSENTKKAYKRSWQKLKEFSKTQAVILQFPVQGEILSKFISFMHNGNYAASSVVNTLSAIGFVHKIMGVRDPTDTFLIKKLVQGCKKLSDSTDTRLPITKPMLTKILEASSKTIGSQFQRICFQAMCALAFHAFLRVGEMTDSPNNLPVTGVCLNDQEQEVVVKFANYKHSNGTISRHVIKASTETAVCPVRNLQYWMRVRGDRMGPLFLTEQGLAIPRRVFCENLKSALSFAGFRQKGYTSHSFRIGAATHMAANGSTEVQIQQAGRWASNAFRKYIRMNAM